VSEHDDEESNGRVARWLASQYAALSEGQRWTLVLALVAVGLFVSFGLRQPPRAAGDFIGPIALTPTEPTATTMTSTTTIAVTAAGTAPTAPLAHFPDADAPALVPPDPVDVPRAAEVPAPPPATTTTSAPSADEAPGPGGGGLIPIPTLPLGGAR
jgi:hypothetical protein